MIDCMSRKAAVFRMIGNSSAYQYNRHMAYRVLVQVYCLMGVLGEDRTSCAEQMDRLTSELTIDGGMISRRHPNPDSNERYLIVDPKLQVRGAWKKIPIPMEVSREQWDYSSFIWKGHIYVVKAKPPTGLARADPPQLWRLNLVKQDKWELVATFPPVKGLADCAFNRLCVDGNKMYSFSGDPHLNVLNLVNKTWSTLKTTWKPTAADRRVGMNLLWPWPRMACAGAAQVIVDQRLYVFGGLDTSFAGCNLLMRLDLKTLKWRRLSGMPWIESTDPRLPGPRSDCGLWVSQDQKTLYIFSGVCYESRDIEGDKHGPPDPWVYDDLWSWDIEGETWCEENMLGNSPSPRFGAGCVFSKKLNKVLVFGGANPTSFTIIGESSEAQFTPIFYADTFMWSPPQSRGSTQPNGNPAPPYWQQIQTVGFPTYRAECHLLVDPDNDDVYLYGGQVLGDSIPSKNHTEVQRRKRSTYESGLARLMANTPSRTRVAQRLGMEHIDSKTFTQRFGDLWKLHIDIPGGGFEYINMEDEIRTAPLGPWNRCFECRKAGFWKKCGGSCDGKAFFCGVDCQRKGWREHKALNGCQKVGKSGSDGKA